MHFKLKEWRFSPYQRLWLREDGGYLYPPGPIDLDDEDSQSFTFSYDWWDGTQELSLSFDDQTSYMDFWQDTWRWCEPKLQWYGLISAGINMQDIEWYDGDFQHWVELVTFNFFLFWFPFLVLFYITWKYRQKKKEPTSAW